MALVISESRLAEILSKTPLADGTMEGLTVSTRNLSEMTRYFKDPGALSSDPMVYQILSWPEEGRETDLLITVTILYPGFMGEEHFHTKGHFHAEPDGPEFVWGYEGDGILELGDRTGSVTTTEVTKGTHVWVPPGTAHRMVNPTDKPVSYLSMSSAGVGHDYDSVVKLGWRRP